MSGKRINEMRTLLRTNQAGMSVPNLADKLGIEKHEASRILRYRMPDAYISHWESNGYGDRAVWRVVIPPPHCPRPRHAKRTSAT